mmetsp:Transcript_49568/g.160215  ORF Transcript_49568/g.160215 Transcript_49568/m.160215 type:complete len:243 (-) Transcript_49568:1833-2561(-)
MSVLAVDVVRSSCDMHWFTATAATASKRSPRWLGLPPRPRPTWLPLRPVATPPRCLLITSRSNSAVCSEVSFQSFSRSFRRCLSAWPCVTSSSTCRSRRSSSRAAREHFSSRLRTLLECSVSFDAKFRSNCRQRASKADRREASWTSCFCNRGEVGGVAWARLAPEGPDEPTAAARLLEDDSVVEVRAARCGGESTCGGPGPERAGETVCGRWGEEVVDGHRSSASLDGDASRSLRRAARRL